MCHKTFRNWFHCISPTHYYLEPEVTGRRVNSGGGYGLDIRVRFHFYGPKKATQWFKTRLIRIEEQLKESKNYYLKLNIGFLWKNGFVICNIRPVHYREVTSK